MDFVVGLFSSEDNGVGMFRDVAFQKTHRHELPYVVYCVFLVNSSMLQYEVVLETG